MKFNMTSVKRKDHPVQSKIREDTSFKHHKVDTSQKQNRFSLTERNKKSSIVVSERSNLSIISILANE